MATRKLAVSSIYDSLSANSQDYQCLRQIGTGFDGLTTIWVACYKDYPKNIVIKKTYLDIPDSEKIDLMRHEVHVSRLLAHRNILPCLCAFVSEEELWTVSPYMGYGSCTTLLETGFPQGLPELAISYILRDVLRALDNIHKMGYIHRAVKGSHILIDECGGVRLSGLRESHCLSPNGYNHSFAYDFPIHAVTTVPWLAPEVLEQNILGYDYRSDIYSVGITAIELACGVMPYSGMTPSQVLLEKLQEGKTAPGVVDSHGIELLSRLTRQTKGKPRKFSLAFSQFVNLCVQKRPDNRPSARALLSHPFFKHNKKKLKGGLPELLLPVLPEKFNGSEMDVGARVGNVVESLDQLTVDSWNF